MFVCLRSVCIFSSKPPLKNSLPSRLGLYNIPTASLQRGKTPPPNEYPGYDTKQSDGEVPVMLELLGNAEHPFIAIALRSTLARNGST